ncbi:hypothetical protein Apa02nite_019440 [Actinoplanes palleronii]|uniref:Uncharacterized protein n=1 Tax=Actinoplanes palleronii TaxID=113570 RepID=A0ABQ4B5A4_9ACTN|nr:hypothetical protein Apa02nite_019440 [Actinoplanes palleronii]
MLTGGIGGPGRLRCEFVEHRYADESGPSWYSGSRYSGPPGYPEAESTGAHALGEGRHDTGAVRLPEQRPAGPEPRGPYESGRIPIRGPEYPTIPPPALPPAPQPIQQPVPQPGKASVRRPLSSVIVAVAVLVLFVPVLRLLMTVTFAADATARGIVPAVLLALGLALTGFGLFSAGNAAAGGGPATRDAWLRAPLIYLPAGVLLLLAAGLAVA